MDWSCWHNSDNIRYWSYNIYEDMMDMLLINRKKLYTVLLMYCIIISALGFFISLRKQMYLGVIIELLMIIIIIIYIEKLWKKKKY